MHAPPNVAQTVKWLCDGKYRPMTMASLVLIKLLEGDLDGARQLLDSGALQHIGRSRPARLMFARKAHDHISAEFLEIIMQVRSHARALPVTSAIGRRALL